MYVVYLAALKLRTISPWSARYTKTNIFRWIILYIKSKEVPAFEQFAIYFSQEENAS